MRTTPSVYFTLSLLVSFPPRTNNNNYYRTRFFNLATAARDWHDDGGGGAISTTSGEFIRPPPHTHIDIILSLALRGRRRRRRPVAGQSRVVSLWRIRRYGFHCSRWNYIINHRSIKTCWRRGGGGGPAESGRNYYNVQNNASCGLWGIIILSPHVFERCFKHYPFFFLTAVYSVIIIIAFFFFSRSVRRRRRWDYNA